MRPRVLAIVAIPTLVGCSAILGFGDYSVDPNGPASEAGLDGEPDGDPDGGRPEDRSFLLEMIPGTVTIVAGATATVRVKVRRGALMKAPITITVSALRDGITQSGTTVLAENEGDLVLQAPRATPQGSATGVVEAAAAGATTRTLPFELFVRGAPGDLDTSFGTAGITSPFVFDAAATELPQDLLTLADGRMVLVGHCSTPTMELCLARVAADGKLDTTFGTGGLARLEGNAPKAAMLHIDGRIVVAGGRSPDVTFVARVNANGTPDNTFGPGTFGPGTTGIVPPLSDPPSTRADGAYGIGVRADDDYLVTFDYVADDGNLRVGTARLNPTGGSVTTYGFEGTSRAGWQPSGSPGGLGQSLAIRVNPTGDPFVVGVAPFGATSVYGIMQFNGASGLLDPAPKFGRAQWEVADLRRDAVTGLVALADGSVVAPFSTTTGVFVAKFLPNIGGPVMTFGTNGRSAVVPTSGAAGGIARAEDGRLLVAVIDDAKLQLELLRFTETGALDTTFGTAGTATAKAGASSSARRVAIQQDGKIIVLGAAYDAGNAHMVLARFWN